MSLARSLSLSLSLSLALSRVEAQFLLDRAELLVGITHHCTRRLRDVLCCSQQLLQVQCQLSNTKSNDDSNSVPASQTWHCTLLPHSIRMQCLRLHANGIVFGGHRQYLSEHFLLSRLQGQHSGSAQQARSKTMCQRGDGRCSYDELATRARKICNYIRIQLRDRSICCRPSFMGSNRVCETQPA